MGSVELLDFDLGKVDNFHTTDKVNTEFVVFESFFQNKDIVAGTRLIPSLRTFYLLYYMNHSPSLWKTI